MDKEQEEYIINFISNVLIESSKLIMYRAREHQQEGCVYLLEMGEITPLVRQATVNVKARYQGKVKENNNA